MLHITFKEGQNGDRFGILDKRPRNFPFEIQHCSCKIWTEYDG